MFEVAELGHTVEKSVYREKSAELRARLLTIQSQLKVCPFSVIIIISGVDGGGKGDVINRLNEWMDVHYMRTIALGPPSDEERERPKFWRFWRTLPAKGTIGVYVGSWYSDPIAQRVYQKIDNNALQNELIQINQLEQLLSDDNTLIIKCWLHLKKEAQIDRLKALAKNPATKWRVTDKDRQHLGLYDDFIGVAEQVLTETSKAHAPWLIVEGSDIRYSSLTVGQHVLERIEQHVLQYNNGLSAAAEAEPPNSRVEQYNLLDALDLSLKLNKSDYRKQLEKYQGKLNELSRHALAAKRSSILVFEGWDAAGKGGAIRRLIEAMDARHYQVISIAAPTDEERAHHYLWRFWRHMPRAGQVTIYDRSWYGRVLVERVEGLAKPQQWQRAYSEIVNFEEAMLAHGIVILKFWLHIDRDEQIERFKRREQISYKQFKITEEDYRNREKWDDYQKAVNEMIARTSTSKSPWLQVEANDKYYARIKIIKAYCERLEKMLDEINK
ncbi:polyphosphate:AMP phosphotransferase [Methylomonas sp. LL1]|uniref:polyphosphate:AMP phosphotransferase n=1 Tax=Methylomonas sp. LL1 TaxID=2785785 RepID=UPI0018C35272|nr:polyphosphate:AMP phosphotransferase [Methylomonas sp. LL1]QPK62002.1 polyphosphate:AMP phosphotransferase [Methylomonas sp. LL1]